MSKDSDQSDPKGKEAGSGNGQPTADELRAQLRTEIASEFQMKIDKLQSVIDEKVTGKKELEQRLRDEAEKRGDYDKALELHKTELEAARGELENIKTQLSEYEAMKPDAEAWRTYQGTRREELLSLLPEASRDAYKEAPLALLEETVKILGTDKGGTHKGGPSKPNTPSKEKWSEMSPADRVEAASILSVEQLAELRKRG